MKQLSRIIVASSIWFCAEAYADGEKPDASPLFDTIAALDAATFDAFNKCGDPAQLKIHAGYFAADVEF